MEDRGAGLGFAGTRGAGLDFSAAAARLAPPGDRGRGKLYRRVRARRHVRGVVVTCQAGFESLLARELGELRGARERERGPGWVWIEPAPGHEPRGVAFAHATLHRPVEVKGDSVNALAAGIADYFLGAVRGERIEAAWPSIWSGPAERVGLGRRMSAVESAFAELLKKKLARVARLRGTDLPRGPAAVRGLFVYFVDFGRAFVAREAFRHGVQRMADDAEAPSRSFLKVEEAYLLLGREPRSGETVCDLGAAPGGWSYSAAKRGAHVLALDNGPLKGGALDHPQIEHRREDAFKFAPPEGKAFDWLFCDLVEEPHHVLRQIAEPWLSRRACRTFVINLKFGRVDPIALRRELGAVDSPLTRHARDVHVQHLYHDREEFTVVGTVP